MARFRMRALAVRGTALTLGAWLLAAAVASAQLPKGEDVLEKYIKATGGKEAYEKLTNQVMHGKMEIVGAAIKGPVKTYSAIPVKMRVEVELEGIGKIEQGTDGKVVWEKNPLTGNRILMGEERATMLRRATFNSDIHWRKLYKTATCEAEEKLDGKTVYKVVLTPESGKPATHYYDKESGLLVKMMMVMESPMGELPSESTISDYKKVDGVLIPHTVRQKVLVQELVISIDKIEHNVKIPEERFAIPEEIKKLLKQ